MAWAGCPPAATWWPCSASGSAWRSTGRCASTNQPMGPVPAACVAGPATADCCKQLLVCTPSCAWRNPALSHSDANPPSPGHGRQPRRHPAAGPAAAAAGPRPAPAARTGGAAAVRAARGRRHALPHRRRGLAAGGGCLGESQCCGGVLQRCVPSWRGMRALVAGGGGGTGIQDHAHTNVATCPVLGLPSTPSSPHPAFTRPQEVQGGGTSLSFFAVQTGCLIWALPCQIFLVIWLWTNKRVGGLGWPL